ncbi:hypothetical protein C3L33_08619, partial [Rhododendron williamsianum]
MAEEVVERIGNFHISDENEEEVITIGEEVCQQALNACTHSLVGKLLTSKRFHVIAMKDSLRRAWGSPNKLSIVEVGDNLFHFRFEDEISLKKVLHGGPWNFENQLLVVQKWEPGMKADQLSFHSVAFWIQLWGLPFEFVNPMVGEIIGKRVGTFLAIDDRKEVGERGRFIRVRVEIPLDKPIKRGGFIALGSGPKYWVDYKYERLNSFCHYCGSLSHDVGVCDQRTADEVAGCLKEGKFGPWLKVGGGGVWGGRQYSASRSSGSGDAHHDSGGLRQGETPSGSSAGTGIFKQGGDLDGAAISGQGSKSRLVELEDNDRISLNGKDLRIRDVLDPRESVPVTAKEDFFGRSGSGPLNQEVARPFSGDHGLVDLKASAVRSGPGSSSRSVPLGPPIQEEKMTDLVPLGLGPDTGLRDVEILESFDKENINSFIISPTQFSVGVESSKVSSSEGKGSKKGKSNKRCTSAGGGRGRQIGQECGGVLAE